MFQPYGAGGSEKIARVRIGDCSQIIPQRGGVKAADRDEGHESRRSQLAARTTPKSSSAD
jgi:hypothetical protein